MPAFGNLLVDQFFRTTVTVTIPVGATTVSVADASGFPVPVGDKYFYLTLVDDNDVAEVVQISDVTGNVLTLAPTTAVQTGFAANTTRAELWFTAEAFEDLQAYIISLGGSTVPYEPDTVSIQLNVLGELEVKPAGVTLAKMASNSVGTAQIVNSAVTNNKLAGGIDAPSKIVQLPSALLNSLNMNHIIYTPVSGAPTGGDTGDIAIEWEALP